MELNRPLSSDDVPIEVLVQGCLGSSAATSGSWTLRLLG